MSKKMTHTGVLIGDARASGPKKVNLRETNNYWISESDDKYRKVSGWPVGQGAWPIYSLDIKSIKEIEGVREV